MIIEWQRVRLRPGMRERFVEKDREIWTPGLSREAGFLGKEVWLGEEESEVILVVRWESREHWKGIPKERLDEIEERFRRELPEGHEIVETRAYEVAGS
ncbi:MAG TPA: TIGR03792 family protein [Thermoanaerobaculia bacterium]|nr:TIGR03792 family protein [Thermoanaerobaculia bacterium]